MKLCVWRKINIIDIIYEKKDAYLRENDSYGIIDKIIITITLDSYQKYTRNLKKKVSRILQILSFQK